MAIFCQETPNSSKICRLFCSSLKEAFSNCHACNRRHLSCSSSEEETPICDFDDVQELVVSMIRSRAMETKFRRSSNMMIDGFSVFHPTSSEHFEKAVKQHTYDDCYPNKQETNENEDEIDDFRSAKSHLSRFSSVSADTEAFLTVNSDFSCCNLSSKDLDFPENKWWGSKALDSSELRRRAIIQEFCHCEGWPFGLCRKALLLPPLPKSPSESWSWCKPATKTVKMY